MIPPTKNLRIKMGTHAEGVWTKVVLEAKELIAQSKDNLIIQTAMLTLGEENIEIEKKKYAATNRHLNK